MKRTEMKHHAQDQLLQGLAVHVGYWEEGEHNWPKGWAEWTDKQKQEYRDIMNREADRVARLFGYPEAWGA